MRVTCWFFAYRVGEIIHFTCRSFAGWEERKSEDINMEKGHQKHICGGTPNLLHASALTFAGEMVG